MITNPQSVYFLPGTMCTDALWQDVWRAMPTSLQPYHIALNTGQDFKEIDRYLGQRLGEEPQHLAGFSMGGYAALHYALHFPERVKSLVIIGASARGLREDEIELRQTFMEVLKFHPYNGISLVRIKQLLSPLNQRNQAIIEQIQQMDKELGKEVLIRQVNATTYRESLMGQLKNIRSPVLIVCGMQDALLNLEEVRQMSELIPDCQVKLIDHCGHMVPLESPQKLARTLGNWYAAFE